MLQWCKHAPFVLLGNTSLSISVYVSSNPFTPVAARYPLSDNRFAVIAEHLVMNSLTLIINNWWVNSTSCSFLLLFILVFCSSLTAKPFDSHLSILASYLSVQAIFIYHVTSLNVNSFISFLSTIFL